MGSRALVRRVLVLRPGAIGDTLVTLPALAALRAQFPAARIEVVGNATALPVVEAAGCADRWYAFDDPRVTRLFMTAAPAADDPFLAQDVVVAWGRDPDGTLQRSFERRGARQVVLAPSRPPPSEPIHVARHLLRSLAPLDIDATAALGLPQIVLPEAVERAAADELDAADLADTPFVAVHVGSGSPAKNWPTASFASVVQALAACDGPSSVVLAGPADRDAIVALQDGDGPPRTILEGRPLLLVAAILKRARGFLGNDSGLSHLAGVLGVPTLTLFGPTDPVNWSPLGPRVRTLRSEPLTALPPDRVLAALRELLAL